MTEPQLLPCPFCGAAAHFEMDEDRWEWVECESCGMRGNRSASLMEDCKPKLAAEWNRRLGAAPTTAAQRGEEAAKSLTEVLAYAERMLTNLQPHIPQSCYPGREKFIDNYVDPVLERLRAALAHKEGNHG